MSVDGEVNHKETADADNYPEKYGLQKRLDAHLANNLDRKTGTYGKQDKHESLFSTPHYALV